MIKPNLEAIKERIASACAATGRLSREITLVAVTKGRTIEQIQEVISCAVSDIGENRIQEAVSKYVQFSTSKLLNSRTPELLNSRTPELLNSPTLRWHMIGHLQTNKVKEAVRIFDLIHSVDSLRLAEAISQEAGKINKIQDILIEVKTSPEKTKSGLAPEEAVSVIKDISRLPNLNLKGLMTLAPLVENPEDARPYFRRLRQLGDQINQLTTHQLTVLSMGMSNDFEPAIEEGSTMLRLGRAIFE